MFFSLRAKLLLCFGLLVALTGGLASYSLSAVDGAAGLLSEVYDEALIGVSSARSAAGKLIAARALMELAVTAPDGATTEQITTLERSATDIGEDLAVVRARVHSPAVGKALDAADAARADWLRSGLLVLAPPKVGVAALPLPAALEAQGTVASAALDDVVDHVAAFGFQMRSAATAAMNTSRMNLTFAAFAIAGIGVLLALGFSHLLARPIRMATRIAEHVASGDYTDRVRTHGRDELGLLLTSLARMQANLIGRGEQDRASLGRLRELSDSTFEGLLIHRDGTVLDANTAFCSLVGLSLDQVKGKPLATFTTVWAETLSASPRPCASAAQEIVITMGNGDSMPAEVQSRDICYADGPARVTALRDIRERHATEARTRFLAHHDVLTGLANRSLLQERLAEAKRATGLAAAVLFLDLDRFKEVNDTMGHAAGDALLVEVSRRLLVVVGAENMVARLGGDEFVVLCRGLTAKAVFDLGERIRQAVEVPFEISGRPCHISASIGTALAERSGGLDLIRAADMAMYAAKQDGGNRAVVFETSLFDRAARQFELEHDLRQALTGGDEFALLYQPIFGLGPARKRCLVGFEALVRWRHPRHGWMSPILFIPLAEKSGLILPLGDWVMATALCQGHALLRVCPHMELLITVNVSALQLQQAGFCSSLAEVLLAEGFPPKSLCLEVTESMLSDAAAASVLADVRKLGVRVAIDDFGIGYSSLSYLRRLPVDLVKLDRSFLEDVEGDASGAGFVEAVVALAHSAGKVVVLEGIETEAQFDIASTAGSDMVQGFLFAPPLSESAAQELVAQHLQVDERRTATVVRQSR
jgi:diguanylate cyclase (GGDEF)-like protein/PAS domain S-box-containing protein